MNQNKLKRKDADLTSTVVYFEPNNKTQLDIQPTHAEISTLNKRFKPDVLAVTVGSEVKFPNMDRILHNVFSVSPNNDFDLGLYSAGTTKSVTFDSPGVIYVHCNVHHSMQADILVLDTPFFTTVDDQGQFELSGITDIEGTLKIWHPRAQIQSIDMNAENALTKVNQEIMITRPKVPKHNNKFGQSYRPTRD